MSVVEDAYQAIGSTLLEWSEGEWEKITFAAPIYGGRCGGMHFACIRPSGKEDSLNFDWNGIDALNEAGLFLRDDLLRTTGQRIWGLTFTLYPSGQFNIEYDYNKPADYEDSDETISLSEALQGLGVDVQVEGLPPKAD